MRYHQYKAFYRTYAVASCNNTNTGTVQHFPTKPLLFDLSVDPAEANPLPEASIDPRLYDKINQLHNEKHAAIFGTVHTTANCQAQRTTAGPAALEGRHQRVRVAVATR